MCYQKGGGKEGQFLFGFGKREEIKEMIIGTKQRDFKFGTTANTATTEKKGNKPVFALMMTNDNKLKVLTTLFPEETSFPNKNSTNSSRQKVEQKLDKIGIRVDRKALEEHIICCTESNSGIEALTLLDSGINNYCFINCLSFISYTPISQPITGLTARKRATFNIISRGDVIFNAMVGGINRKVTLKGALHISSLRSNLILILLLGVKEISINFD